MADTQHWEILQDPNNVAIVRETCQTASCAHPKSPSLKSTQQRVKIIAPLRRVTSNSHELKAKK
ncbi:ATP-binding mismatch repair protein [Komagataella phaffii]